MTYEEVLQYWFGSIEETPAYLKERGKLWYGGGPALDEEIRNKFEPLVEQAAAGQLAAWEAWPDSCLALLILLDQFPLNIYRNQARGYELGDLAIPVALRALEKGYHREVHSVQATFFFLPLEHSESMAHQERAVALFTSLEKNAESDFWGDWAKGGRQYAERHRVVIEKFGRFPHRNEALGRASTPEEKEYLAKGVWF